MDLALHPLDAARWPDLETLFAAKGCSMARGCWCMAYRESGAAASRDAAQRKARLHALARRAQPAPGLLAYRAATPVGWLSLGPREDFARLRRSPVMKPLDDRAVWAIVCFVVPPALRGQGIATALLQGGIEWARSQGVRCLEAYPIDKDEPGAAAWLWHGAASMFRAAGFVEQARRKPTRPLMRLELAA